MDSAGARVITHESCTTVRRAAPEVARYVLDPTTMPEWSAVIYQVEAPGDGVLRPGGRLRGNMHILGVSLTVEGEMVHYDGPGMRAAIVVRPVVTGAGVGGVLEHEVWVEDGGGVSVLHFRNRLTLPSWVPAALVTDGFVQHLLDQTSSFALANIKYILESASGTSVREFMKVAARYLPAPKGL
ncbi:MAG: SRPBCC family protein [Actinomycetota bacterium]